MFNYSKATGIRSLRSINETLHLLQDPLNFTKNKVPETCPFTFMFFVVVANLLLIPSWTELWVMLFDILQILRNFYLLSLTPERLTKTLNSVSHVGSLPLKQAVQINPRMLTRSSEQILEMERLLDVSSSLACVDRHWWTREKITECMSSKLFLGIQNRQKRLSLPLPHPGLDTVHPTNASASDRHWGHGCVYQSSACLWARLLLCQSISPTCWSAPGGTSLHKHQHSHGKWKNISNVSSCPEINFNQVVAKGDRWQWALLILQN